MKQTARVAGIPVINMALRAMFALLAAALVMFVMQNFAHAQGKERSGKDVVDSTCSKCHASGAQGAPKIGDKQAWSKLSEQGLSSLTKIALEGIRNMPPHGANMKLTDTEIKRAVTYMVNQSGGKWIEPTSHKNPPAPRTGEQIVKAQCSKCHEKGLHGAPKIGDRDAWIPRLEGRARPGGAFGDQWSRPDAGARRHGRSHRRRNAGCDYLHVQQGSRARKSGQIKFARWWPARVPIPAKAGWRYRP